MTRTQQWFPRYDTKSTCNQRKKIGKYDFIKIRNFCASKDTIRTAKSECTEGGKIVANNVSDKGLVSRIYKEILQLKNTNSPNKYWHKNQNNYFIKDDMQMAKDT